MKHAPVPSGMPETAPILREVHASEPLWVTMVRLSVGAAVVLGLTIGAVVVNDLPETQHLAQHTVQQAVQHTAVAANGH